jgi:hypothetical protein
LRWERLSPHTTGRLSKTLLGLLMKQHAIVIASGDWPIVFG